jgi:hypothetical protein
MGARLKKAGARVGHVTVSLMWHNTDDLDLHCESAAGGHIWWSEKKGTCGGHLDVDMNATERHLSTSPIENLVWDKPPLVGKYRIWVENTEPRNPSEPTAFTVRLTRDGKTEDKVFADIKELEEIDVFSFEQIAAEPEPESEPEPQPGSPLRKTTATMRKRGNDEHTPIGTPLEEGDDEEPAPVAVTFYYDKGGGTQSERTSLEVLTAEFAKGTIHGETKLWCKGTTQNVNPPSMYSYSPTGACYMFPAQAH